MNINSAVRLGTACACVWVYILCVRMRCLCTCTQVSPITGELVAIADMAEHMRVSLIDPRWKEQREAMLSKIR